MPTLDRRHTSQIGTALYMAPEIMTDGNYSLPVDIYSLGRFRPLIENTLIITGTKILVG